MKSKKYSKRYISTEKTTTKTQKKSKTGIIIVAFIVFLMIFSVAASVFFYRDNNENQDKDNEYSYNGYEFKLTQNGWETKIKNNILYFDYLPDELGNITSDLDISYITAYTEKEHYIIFDPSQLNYNGFEIYKLKLMLSQFGETYFPACSTENNCGDLPIKKCEKGDIYLEISSTNEITKTEKECITLKSAEGWMIKVINRYIYKKIGI